ncbi:MAG: DUF2339 domain-containing protein [Acidobacteria bacterium]|nr:DUF2339 domain-containing protein [Acidobacteriota bacterium]
MSEEPNLDERVVRLEAQVAWLWQQVQALQGATTGPPQAPRASTPLPARRPAPPPRVRKPLNPILFVAAAGAGIFLLGAVFFLHLAIQRGWIGPEARFLLGLLAGAGITAGAARMILGSSRKVGVSFLLAGLGTLIFTLRWGAFEAHFFPPSLGFAASSVAVLFAGALAARARSGASLCVALASGLLSPLVFSQGGHHEVALAVILSILLASALAIPYATGAGARWGVSRWLAVAGTWILLALCCLEVLPSDAPALLGLLGLHLMLSGLWVWLPRIPERPSTPTLLWSFVSVFATLLAWVLWKRLGWMPEAFAGPILGLGALNLALVKPLRVRLGDRRADFGLLALAAGHLALAVPVALAWAWVGPFWAAYALALAWLSGSDGAGEGEVQERRHLAFLAVAVAALATGRWLFHLADLYPWRQLTPVFNTSFAEGLLAALAWGFLARRGGPLGILSFALLQLVANVGLALEAGQAVRWLGGSARAASMSLTLTYAASGAGQWIRSLREARPGLARGLAVAGYVWLALAGLKLVVVDLDRADMALRAVVFLGVGGIFLGAALVANRVRLSRKEAE